MKTNKRFLALCLALLLVCAVLPAPTAQGADVQPVLSAALAHQAAAVPSPGYGDEWTVLGLARGGYFAVDSDYFARYYADVASKAPELTAASGKAGALNAYKSTDNSRVILALSAIGRDATQVGGCDLTAPYTDFAWCAIRASTARCLPCSRSTAAITCPAARCAASAWMQSSRRSSPAAAGR